MQTSTHFSSNTPTHNITFLLYHTLLELTLPQEYTKAHTSTDYYKNRVVCALCLTPIMRMHCTMIAQSILQRTCFFLFYSQLIYNITSNCIQAVIGNVINNYVKRYIFNEMKSIMILNFSARQSAQCLWNMMHSHTIAFSCSLYTSKARWGARLKYPNVTIKNATCAKVPKGERHFLHFISTRMFYTDHQ